MGKHDCGGKSKAASVFWIRKKLRIITKAKPPALWYRKVKKEQKKKKKSVRKQILTANWQTAYTQNPRAELIYFFSPELIYAYFLRPVVWIFFRPRPYEKQHTVWWMTYASPVTPSEWERKRRRRFGGVFQSAVCGDICNCWWSGWWEGIDRVTSLSKYQGKVVKKATWRPPTSWDFDRQQPKREKSNIRERALEMII